MNIGIKYCGGCNPSYDRKEQVEILEKALLEAGVTIDIYKDGNIYDFCIIVKGCTRSCISVDALKGCRRIMVAESLESFREIQNHLILNC